MAFVVQIIVPASGTMSDMPIQANGTVLATLSPATAFSAAVDGTVDSMWYQVDGGDAQSFDSFQADGSAWSFQLANICAGLHDLTVFARSSGGTSPATIVFSDSSFTVSQPVPQPLTIGVSPPGP